jgi:hypothetical protein
MNVAIEVESDPRPRRLREAAVPRRRPEPLVGRELPARILGVDAEVLAVPIDVGVRIEVLRDRLPAQPADELEIGLGAPGGALLFGDGVVGAEQGARSGGRRHG